MNTPILTMPRRAAGLPKVSRSIRPWAVTFEGPNVEVHWNSYNDYVCTCFWHWKDAMKGVSTPDDKRIARVPKSLREYVAYLICHEVTIESLMFHPYVRCRWATPHKFTKKRRVEWKRRVRANRDLFRRYKQSKGRHDRWQTEGMWRMVGIRA